MKKKTKGFIRISLLRKSKKKAFDIMRVFGLDEEKTRFKSYLEIWTKRIKYERRVDFTTERIFEARKIIVYSCEGIEGIAEYIKS